MQDMHKKHFYKSHTFSLFQIQTPLTTKIIMQMHIPCLNTKSIPMTLLFLKNMYPQVLKTQCFNDDGLSFREEVKATEIGHLFEHILIEEIYSRQSAKEKRSVVINGNTAWNWYRDPRGTFHILVDRGSKDKDIVEISLHKAVLLIEQLLTLRIESKSRRSKISRYIQQPAVYV